MTRYRTILAAAILAVICCWAILAPLWDTSSLANEGEL
jgi:hypothetical protein